MPEPFWYKKDFQEQFWALARGGTGKILRGLAVTSLGLTAASLGIAWGSHTYVAQHLLPQLETTLADTLGRQVDLGDPTYLWPWQIAIGSSTIENLATVSAIQIRPDLWRLLSQQQLALHVHLVKPQLLWMETLDRGWADLDLRLPAGSGAPALPLTELTLSVQEGELTAIPIRGERRTLKQLTADGNWKLGEGSPAQFRVKSRLADQPLDLQGWADFGGSRGSITLTSPQLPLDLLPSILPNLPIPSITGDSSLDLTLGWQPNQPLFLAGSAQVKRASLGITPIPKPFTQIQGSLEIASDRITLTNLQARYGGIPFQANGPIRWAGEEPGYQLEATVAKVALPDILQTFQLSDPLDSRGHVKALVQLTGSLDDPLLSGKVQSLGTGQVDRIPLTAYATDFALENQVLRFANIRTQSAGGSAEGSGEVRLTAMPTAQFDWQVRGVDTSALARFYGATLPRSLGQLDGQGQLQITGSIPSLQADWRVIGGEIQGKGQLDWQAGMLTIPQSQLLLGQGKAAVTARLQADWLEAEVSPDQVALAFFSPGQTGALSGDFRLRASRRDLSLAGLRASGRVELTEGLAGLPGSITGLVSWDGQGLTVEQANLLPQVAVTGRIPVNPQTLAVGSLDLTVTAQPLSLATLPQIPALLDVSGQVEGQARLTGERDALQLIGDLRLRGAKAGGLQFSELAGPIRWDPQESHLDLQGNGDRLAVRLDSRWQPLAFHLKQGEIEAKGSPVPDQPQQFAISLSQLPLQLLAGLAGQVGIAGNLEANLTVNLKDWSTQGKATVAQLQMAGLTAQQLSADFAYGDGQFRLAQASLQLFDSLYQAKGHLRLPTPASPTPHLELQLATSTGKLQDIVSTFKWQEWQDLAERGWRLPPLKPAAAVAAQPIETSSLPLWDQLALHAEQVRTQLALAAAQMEPLIPPPTALQGDFQAAVTLAGSLTDLKVGFDLAGQNWSAAEFRVESLTAAGSLAEGSVNLTALSLRSGERVTSFQGNLGLEEQSGSLQITAFPLDLLNRFVPDHLNLQGDLNGSMTLMGNLRDPSAQGQITLAETRINQVPLQAVNASFDYDEGQLRLDSTIATGGENPITIAGLVPYRLPFAEVESPRQEIDVQLLAQDEGLKLINLLTDQVRWQGGDSQISLLVQGTLQEPVIQGSLTVNSGTMQLSAFPQPITDIQGEIAFNTDQLEVKNLTGSFSQGSLTASGSLPINTQGALSQGDAFVPLTVQLNQLYLDLPKFYQGKLAGSVKVGGLLQQPLLEGQLVVSDGKLDVSPNTDPSATEVVTPEGDDGDPAWQPQLNGLLVTLGSNTEITRGRLFNFRASGDLKIFGTLQDPQPAGTINLERGLIDLAIASFRLDRSRRNTAVFDLDNGLDPFLDLRLVTQATEVYQNPQDIALFNNSSNTLGSTENIDIFASVQGRASALGGTDPQDSILELTSSPPRSESEIIALLGSDAVALLSSGSAVGLAGSTLLNNIQDELGQSLGLDISLRPIPQISTAAPNRFSVGLGLEVAKDLGSQISVSAQRNLTDAFQPTRYNARYRLHPNILTRLSTDFEGNSSASIEWETRF
ncbi:MAG: translocation/assembly module TamB domain-containing protein [Cyanobacteriota bacterium]|nr:translocation/assembly module TamB domain-containing protein [Cyanobacteriota bacterium]